MMKKRLPIRVIVFVFLGLLAACGGQAPDAFKVTLVVEPDPPIVGDGVLTFLVTTPDDKPVDDLSVELSMGMNNMQMGAENGLADAAGKGAYRKSVTFHTKGNYAVQVYFNRGGRTLLQKEFKFSIN